MSRASLILANFLAIGATWFTMRRDRAFSYVRESGGRTLAGVLLWDGGCIPQSRSDMHNADWVQNRVHLLHVSAMRQA